MIAFPSTTLPLPSINYQATPKIPTIASPITRAVVSRRRRSIFTYGSLNVEWVLSPAELILFETFVDTTLGNAAAQFLLELRHPQNTAVANWLVRFSGSYTVANLGGQWRVSGVLELTRIFGAETSNFCVIGEESGDPPYVLFVDSGGNNYTIRN